MDYEYFSEHYKLIAIDLSKQIDLENPNLKQQIKFQMIEQQCFSSLRNNKRITEETTFEFSQYSVSIINWKH